jgi:hypothetical protein
VVSNKQPRSQIIRVLLTSPAPPNYPLYPEPQPLGTGRFLLNTSAYKTHLPTKFHGVKTAGAEDEIQVVVVHSDGALKVEAREKFFQHASQWTHYDGRGGYVDDRNVVLDFLAPKDQARERRWSYVPWTRTQEESCRGGEVAVCGGGSGGGSAGGKTGSKLTLKLRL